ncbi:hypothetical protein O6H91_08G096600 [Diphasiastrum complanatum]|uniref:Uncharacterized protein n=1 Tax=Diphasiastrum complanatum TaxID=34168 RepID=A0ACC2D090_DIPCM|nr:hypothetical protein O6H91_08G096600 [Diphasiastrum complanatum]
MGIVRRSPSFLLEKAMCHTKRGLEDVPHVKSGEFLDHHESEHSTDGSQLSFQMQTMPSLSHSSSELHLSDVVPLLENSVMSNESSWPPHFFTKNSWSTGPSDYWQAGHKSPLDEDTLLAPTFESLSSSCLLEPQLDLSLSQFCEPHHPDLKDEYSFMRQRPWHEAQISPGEFLREMPFCESSSIHSEDSIPTTKNSQEPYYIQVPNALNPGTSTCTIDLLKLQHRLEEERAATFDTFIFDITRKLQSGLEGRLEQGLLDGSTGLPAIINASGHGHSLGYDDIFSFPNQNSQSFVDTIDTPLRHTSRDHPYLMPHFNNSDSNGCGSKSQLQCQDVFATSMSRTLKNSLDTGDGGNSCMNFLRNAPLLSQKVDMGELHNQWGYGIKDTRSNFAIKDSAVENGGKYNAENQSSYKEWQENSSLSCKSTVFSGTGQKEEPRRRSLQIGSEHPESANKRIRLEKNSSSWTSLKSFACTKPEASSGIITKSSTGSKSTSGHALNTNLTPRARQGSANDPQSIAARHRRERISERLKTLQELVPNGTKVDLVTMLEKAINYVKFLQLQVKVLTTDEYWPNSDKLKAPPAPDASENSSELVGALEASENSEKTPEAANISSETQISHDKPAS